MPYPEFGPYDCGAPVHMEEDEDTGEVFCTCNYCKAERNRRGRLERQIDDYEYGGYGE